MTASIVGAANLGNLYDIRPIQHASGLNSKGARPA